MSKVYVLMGETLSPIAINIPYPVEVFRRKRDADTEAKRRNAYPYSKRYYTVRSAQMKEDKNNA